MDDLDRMYRLLVRNVRASAPDYLARPFELSELYQNLIPYRHYRRELGIETNEDYELALSRLLAGERGYMLAEPEVQRALQRELGAPNPDPSAFRQYAHAQVALAQEALRAVSVGDGVPVQRSTPGAGAPTPVMAPPPPPAPTAVPVPPPAPVRPSAAMAPPSAPAPIRASSNSVAAPPLDAPVAGRAPLTVEASGPCRYCGGELPDGRRITFCPHCGQNLTVQHCAACGTELEVGWKFCVTCGRASD